MIQSDYRKIITEILKPQYPWDHWVLAQSTNRWNNTRVFKGQSLQQGYGGWGYGPGRKKTSQFTCCTPSGLKFHYRIFNSNLRKGIIKSITYES